MAIEFDVDQFRDSFAAFCNETTYPDDILQMYWDMATCYVTDEDYGCLTGNCRRLAINLMTAHLCIIAEMVQSGNTPAQVTNATIDKVSVSTAPPPNRDQYDWWLGLTAYGAQLGSLLTSNSAGGLYVGGRAEKSAIRKVGGFY